MKKVLSWLLIAVLLCGMTACGSSETPAPDVQNEEETQVTQSNALPKDKTYRVLFIGNSYTYYHELWELFRQVGEGAGYTFEVDHVTQGGYYLDQHANPDDPFGMQVEEKLTGDPYDYVVIQEQSTCAFQNYERFEAAVVDLAARIEKNGAKCVLYQTWGRQPGSPALPSLGMTNASMTTALIEGYDKAAQKVGAMVTPVGAAFYSIVTGEPSINLYDPDTTHPSLEGSYLSALCHFATITGADPRETTFTAELDEATVTALKQAAYDAVF